MSSFGCCLLLLLCLSLHACGARHSRTIAHGDQVEKRSRFLTTQDEDEKSRNGEARPASPCPEGVTTKSSRAENLGPPPRKAVGSRDAGRTKAVKGGTKREKFSGATEIDRVVSSPSGSMYVSWRVPKENAELKQQPRLDSDYTEPKTHPPHNN